MPVNRNHSSIFSIIKRYFSPVWDIYDVETLFSLHYACGAWSTRFRTSKHAQKHANRNHSPILSIIKRYFPPFEIFRRINALFIALCARNVFHAISSVEARPDVCKSQSFFVFFWKLCVISLPFEIFTSFTRSFYFILHAERSVRVFQRRKKTKHTQIAILVRFFR